MTDGERLYRSLREQASALIAAGHADAYTYPIGQLWLEFDIWRRRETNLLVTAVYGLHAAIVQSLAGGKALEEFTKVLDDGG